MTEENNKMEKTLRRQIFFTMTALVAGGFIVLFLCNNIFLGRFYMFEKKRTLKNTFNEINAECKKGTLYTEKYSYKFEKLCANNNLGVIVMSSDGSLLLSSQNQGDIMINQLFDIMLKNDDSADHPLEAADDYSIRRGSDAQTNNDYLLLWGNLSDGNVILIRTAIESIRDASSVSNRFLVYMGIITLVIAVIAAELVSRRLTSYIRKLSDENAALTRDIIISRENDKMRKEFLSNVSHELKTPIALIQGYAEGLDGVDGEDAVFYREVIIDEAKKMNTLVQKLLSLNRLEYGSGNIDYENFDISEVIRGVIESNSISAGDRGVSMNFEPPKEEMIVHADPLLAEQVVTNYITNAIRYCGGENPVINVSLSRTDDIVRMSVFNTGSPIEEEKLSHIWEKFYKVDPARTREKGGTGIGLSIVRAIADQMEGDCGVINYDNGVEFWFNFHFFVEELRQ